ncbi:MAG: hypothetical protein HY253_06575 [Burkholderiales bacterium]|nr:hypothetical protein [Burkholderiales bacterium]
MMPDFQKPLAVLCVVLTVGLGLMTWKADRLESDIALLKAGHKAELDATAIAGKDRLIKASALAESLTVRLRLAEEDLQDLKERKQHEVVKVATNRTCFNADLVRVLNSSDQGSDPAGMPAPLSSVDTGDEAIATDTDVALWIENAKEQYEVCRARYKALIDFYPPKPSTSIKHD